jgi:hypothetical protein
MAPSGKSFRAQSLISHWVHGTIGYELPLKTLLGTYMLWVLSGCFMGALGALFQHLELPYAAWFNIAGIGLVAVGVLLWLNALGGGTKRSSSDSGSCGSGFDNSGGCGGGDGGCGGD